MGALAVIPVQPSEQFKIELEQVGEEQVLVVVDQFVLNHAVKTLAVGVHLRGLRVGVPVGQRMPLKLSGKVAVELAAIVGEHCLDPIGEGCLDEPEELGCRRTGMRACGLGERKVRVQIGKTTVSTCTNSKYEEEHPQRCYEHPSVHQRFIAQIARMAPGGCRPIVMTDTGFRSSWFQLVAARGWDWVGHIRHRDLVQGAAGGWQRATGLYRQASATARDLGQFVYVRSNPVACRLVLIKQAAKGQHRANIYGAKMKAHDSTKHARREREPWLLASSIGLTHLTADTIVKLYAQRMRIVQSFRDTKNQRFRMGLASSRSRSRLRFEMLLLLAHLASFVLRLIGESARRQQLELTFQSTNRRKRPEISVMTLARRVLDPGSLWLKQLQSWAAIPPLTQQAHRACSCS